MDARLKDGSRVNVVMKPVAVKLIDPYDTNIPGRTIDDEEADRLWKYDRRSGTVHQKIGYCKI